MARRVQHLAQRPQPGLSSDDVETERDDASAVDAADLALEQVCVCVCVCVNLCVCVCVCARVCVN